MWTVQLSYTAPGIDIDRREDIAAALGANVVYDDSDGRLTLTFEAEGATLRQAADAALRDASTAVLDAARGLMPAKPTRMLVMSTEDYTAELEHPGALDQVGVAEISDLFGVSRQRAGQLVERPDFPAPVSRLRSGPVFSASSVAAFHQRWLRGRSPQGGRPFKDPGELAHAGSPRAATAPKTAKTARGGPGVLTKKKGKST